MVFVDGDFWHGRHWEARRARLATGSNPQYWLTKIAANMERDARKTAELERRGWTVVRVWEGDVNRDAEGIAAQLRARLSALAGQSSGRRRGGLGSGGHTRTET